MTDKDTFCDQIRLQEKAMYYLAFSIVKNEADAAEVISEAIFRAYKNLDTLKNIQAFKPWILRIVHNTAVEFIRKNSKTISFDEVEPISESNENKFTASLSVKEAVKSLKQPYRTVIVLYYYEDLSILQIAKITNATTVTVKQRLSRARKQLREILKEDFRNE